MKKLLLISLVALIVAMPGGLAFTQDEAESPAYMLLGGKYDNEDGATITLGFMKDLGGGFHLLGYGDMGDQNSANVEGAYLVNFGSLKFGPLLGPNSDWEPVATATGENDQINYFVGAAGLTATFAVAENMAIYGVFKRKIPLEKSNYDGLNLFGFGLSLKL